VGQELDSHQVSQINPVFSSCVYYCCIGIWILTLCICV